MMYLPLPHTLHLPHTPHPSPLHRVNHSKNAIVKPQGPTAQETKRDVDEAMKKVKETMMAIEASVVVPEVEVPVVATRGHQRHDDGNHIVQCVCVCVCVSHVHSLQLRFLLQCSWQPQPLLWPMALANQWVTLHHLRTPLPRRPRGTWTRP